MTQAELITVNDMAVLIREFLDSQRVVTAGLKEDLDGISMAVDDLSARLSAMSETLYHLRQDLKIITTRQDAADARMRNHSGERG